LRFVGVCYRAHDPRWSFLPLSGDGAAVHGGRFNPKGVPALYLALTLIGAITEANQGFPFKIRPYTVCSYQVDCEGIADLRDAAGCQAEGVPMEDLGCAWFADIAAGREPGSWAVARRLMAAGRAGTLVASFAPGATSADHNLVLWRWGDDPARRISVHDPDGHLPRDQRSWQ
jgi:RES domain-containing protein